MVFGVTGLIIYGFVFVLVEIFSPEGIRAKSKKRKEKQRR
jgi:ABC-type branched-subunit amino acid transport system permease subunit